MKKCAIILALLLLTGCADTVTFVEAAGLDPVGFWYGMWHGVCLPFSLIGSLFDESISIYAIYNNGGWYDIGFFLGISSLSTTAT